MAAIEKPSNLNSESDPTDPHRLLMDKALHNLSSEKRLDSAIEALYEDDYSLKELSHAFQVKEDDIRAAVYRAKASGARLCVWHRDGVWRYRLHG